MNSRGNNMKFNLTRKQIEEKIKTNKEWQVLSDFYYKNNSIGIDMLTIMFRYDQGSIERTEALCYHEAFELIEAIDYGHTDEMIESTWLQYANLYGLIQDKRKKHGK